MKALNKVCQISAIVFAAAALVLFFVAPYATIGNEGFVGAELAFGGGVWKSAHILFCFILTVFSLLFSALTFKTKGMRYASPVAALITAIYTLVIALSSAGKFVDARPIILEKWVETAYTWVPLTISLVLFAGFICGVAHLFVDDLIMVRESKGKRPILRRFIQWLRDYKSEIKKIVWPSLRDVAKNTLVVLVISAVIGIFIWLVDWGLGSLMEFISKIA